MKKSFLLLSLLFLFLIHAKAQQISKSGGISGNNFLFSLPNFCAKSQSIYLPSDLTNVMSGNIITLYFKYDNNGTIGQTMNNFTIKMGQTAATSFANGDTFFTGLTTVLTSAAYSIPAGTAGNWFPISLTNPFPYDATQTLIIEFNFSSTSSYTWSTTGTSNTPLKKIMSSNVNSLTGTSNSSIWQDMGFDLAPVSVSPIELTTASFSIFPNPCKDKLTISVPENNSGDKTKLILVNSLGETTMHIEISSRTSETLYLATLPRGIYFLKDISSPKGKMQKIVLE